MFLDVFDLGLRSGAAIDREPEARRAAKGGA